MMKLVSKRDIIRGVRERWLSQYKHYANGYICGWCNRPAGEIRAALNALDLETCSSEDVDKAIGTEGWAKNGCDVCDADCETIVQIGEDPGYDARWQDLCGDCLSQAAALALSSQERS